jgi:outer membrane autotransporter protein
MQLIRLRSQIGALTFGAALLAAAGTASAQTTQAYSAIFPGTPNLFTLPGLTPAQLTMAHSIDNLCPNISALAMLPDATDDQMNLATICGNMIGTAVVLQGGANPGSLPVIPGLTIADVKNSLTQINGGAETVVPTSQASVLRNLQGNVVASRLSVLHMRMIGGTGMGSDEQARTTLLAMGQGASAQDAHGNFLVAQNAPTEVSMWHDKLGFFFNGIGQFGDSDTTGTQNGYSFDNEGLVFGADYRFTPALTIGASFGYTYSNTEFDVTPQSAPGQHLRGNLFEGSLYASWYATDQLYFDTIASIGGGENDSLRHIVIPGLVDASAKGSFGTRTYGIAVGGGYSMPFGALTLTPTARFEFRRVESDTFTESGAGGLNLTYGSTSQDAVLSFIGGQGQYAISTSFGVVIPTARVEWVHQYNSGNNTVSVAYLNDPVLSSFTLASDKPTRDYADIGLGVALQLEGNWSGFLNYDAIVGITHTTLNNFTAGLRYGF